MWRKKAYGFFWAVIPKAFRLYLIAKRVRAGKVPQGVSKEIIFEALRRTRKGGVLEAFGLLSCRVFSPDGKLKQDLGLVGVKEVTTEYVKHLVDAMTDSGVSVDVFNKHAMGDGSTAETDSQTGLINQQDGRNAGTQTHGATSNIYRTVATITAGSAYTAIEHAVFDSTGSASDVMLDRTLVASPPTLATDDEVEWTYELTVNAGG